MLNLTSSTLQRKLPFAVVKQVHHLLQQMKSELGEDALLLTEQVLLPTSISGIEPSEQFTLLLSPTFSALFMVQSTAQQPTVIAEQVSLTFDPIAIADFISALTQTLGQQNGVLEMLQRYRSTAQVNDATLQSGFTLRLIDLLANPQTQPDPDLTTDSPYDHFSVCQPFQDALENQIEQGLLLSRVTNQIRQSLNLNAILETALEQVRQCLNVDRLVIYQFDFNPDAAASPSPQPLNGSDVQQVQTAGYIAYESRASQEIPSVLHASEANCFTANPACRDKYQTGKIVAVDDVEEAYVLSPCLLKFLQESQVRAKLIVPILVHEKLWGLLIAHQCFTPRQWQAREQKFLEQIAEHLAIAIHQAKLYQQLQQQKQTLEQRVMERTQDLHDALIAAQAADQAKSEFLATMSHELRTPLTCVIGMSSTLLRWSFGDLNRRQRSYLQTIHDSGERLLELINDILDMSHIEAGRAMLNMREFSLSGLASQSLEAVRERALNNGVSLNLDLNLATGQDTFVADPQRVRQILMNLLSNAVKFTPTGGTVKLKVRAESNAAIFQVEDTGIGISEEQRPLLFQKFQQLDPSRRRSYGGTGLGLALTKQLVELHGGWLGVESKVGVGSVFTVRIPSQRVSLSASAREGQSIEGVLPSRRVVLFEEDEESANIVCDMLTAAGHQVIWMIDGSTVPEQVKLMDPALVILGMDLSGADSCDLIRTLRNSPATQLIKILALVADVSNGLGQHCLEAGADDYVTKPIRPDQLLDRINALIYTAPNS